MADITKTVAIIFEGDNRVGKTISGISSSLDSLGDKATSATQPFADLAENALLLEGALAGLAIGGLVLAFNASKDFESASVELQKVIGEEEKLLSKAKESALELSDQYGQSASSILSSTADFKQAGFNVKESLDLTKASLDLVIAGDLEAAEASDILVGALKGFKAPAEDAVRITDILNEVSNNYATSVGELGIGLKDLSPIARGAGFSLEETAGILTPVIEVFQSGSEAATALKTGLLSLVSDSAKVKDALASIGVSQRDANGDLRSGKDILFDVSEAFVDLNENQKLYLTQQLVGKNQSARLIEVFNGLAKSTEVTATALNSAGSAAKEVEARLASAEVAVDRFETAFRNLGITVGDQFREAAKEAIDGGTDIENALTNLVKTGTFDPIFDLIRDFGTQLGSDLRTIAEILPEAFEQIDWEPFLDSLRNLGGEVGDLFRAFFGDIDLTTPEGLATAIQKVVDGGTALTNVVGGILDAWGPFISAISAGIEKFTESDEELQKLVGQFLGWSDVVNTVAGRIGLLTGSLDLIAGSISLLAVTKIPSLISGLAQLSTTIGVGGAVGVGLLGTVSALASVLGTLVALTPNTALGSWARDNVPFFKEFAEQVDRIVLGLGNFITGEPAVDSSAAAQKESFEKTAGAVANLVLQLEEIPVSKQIAINVALGEAFGDVDFAERQLGSIPNEKDVNIKATTDEPSFTKAKEIIIETTETGDIVLIQAKPDEPSFAETKTEIEKIPTEKQLEIQLQGEIDLEIAEIKAKAETLQASFEWQAKVDIAEIEATAEIITALSGDITDAFINTGDVITSLTGDLSGLSASEFLTITRLIEAESTRRDRLLQLEQDLSKAQIDYLQARTEALKGGGGLITIRGENLEPELQLVLQRIIELTQIEANEQGLEFLIGV